VNRLRCEDCGTIFYSAAAKTLVEQGAVCAKCGGRLVMDDDPGSLAVTGPPVREGNGEKG
jgi:DNA-directed RNA polymerase subunit RPC12/RpoP